MIIKLIIAVIYIDKLVGIPRRFSSPDSSLYVTKHPDNKLLNEVIESLSSSLLLSDFIEAGILVIITSTTEYSTMTRSLYSIRIGTPGIK